MSSNGTKPELYTVPLQINGKEVQAPITFDVISPETKQIIWRSSSASKQEAVAAAESAQAAFPTWAATKPAARRDILLKACTIFERRSQECAEYLKAETAATPQWAEGLIAASIEIVKDVAGRIVTISSSAPISAHENMSVIVYKEPYGVVLGIASWNAPYHLGIRAIAYAIATGNTVILKGHELTPRCFWVLGSIFEEAGLPHGCLQVLTCRTEDAVEITTTLIEHPAVKKINFTGSVGVGSSIAATCGKNLKPCLMELGGKASAIVLKDADLGKAALQCALGSFLNGGQICMATEKILVHKSIAPAFAEALKGTVNHIFGPQSPPVILVMPSGVEKHHTLIADACNRGAKLLLGDADRKDELRPVILEGVTRDSELYQQESFGPSVSLLTFEDEAEAIRVANDTQYGLSAAVFTEDLRAGLRVAKQIESGFVAINSRTTHDEPSLPHGGVKKSGFGRFNGNAGLEEFLKMKTVTWNDS